MKNILKVIAIDDEEIALNRICRLIGQNQNLELVRRYTDSEEVLKNMILDKVDIAFLDIEMPKFNGLELAEIMINENPNLEVIFVTAYDKYALQAFQSHAIGYLLKPVEQVEIDYHVDRILSRFNRQNGEKQKDILYLKTFGGFECSLNHRYGEKITFRTTKALELLAYLHDKQGEYASGDKIMEELWPQMDAKRAADNFHTTAYYLRKALTEAGFSDILICKKGEYVLNKENMQSDLKELLSSQNFENAAKYYKGIYLDGKDYSWAIGKRVKYEIYFEKTQLSLEDKYIKEKRNPDAIQVLKILLEHIPSSEEGNKKLILLYIEMDQRQNAMKVYKTYSDILKKDFGVKPTEEIKNILK